MEGILSKYYVQKYFTDEDRKRLSDMTEEVIDALREDFGTLEWLSETGKAAAIEKLDNMIIHIIDMDYDKVSYDDVSITPKAEGGTFIDAYMQCLAHTTRVWTQRAVEPFDRALWDPNRNDISTLTVNACYMPTFNSFFIYAGILADPMYNSTCR